MKAPVVLFVYNRATHTQKVLEALSNNKEAIDTELYVFSDGAPDEVEQNNVATVREVLYAFSNRKAFKQFEIIEARENKGLEKSIIEGVSQIINKYGRAIVLEDDIVVAPDFLNFMNRALDYYETDNAIWSISGHSTNSAIVRRGKRDIYVGCRAECYGWASWANRWNKVDWNVEDYDEFIKDKKKQHEFNKGGIDLTSLLIKQHNGEIHSWAIRWCYQQFKEGMLTVFPKNTKICNIGFDGSGVHYTTEQTVKRVNFYTESDWDFSYDINNKLVANALKKEYFFSYLRQHLGEIWYMLTEYEYCVSYRRVLESDETSFTVLKPNYREWYADPIPYSICKKEYVFMEVFDKWKGKGVIGVSLFNENGILQRPTRIIEEDFHMSFPSVFEYHENIFMIPECSQVEQLRIYKMEEDAYHWKIYKEFSDMGCLVDVVAYQNEEILYLLGTEVNEKNPHQSKLVVYKLSELENEEKCSIELLWKQDEFLYGVRNGGNIFEKDKKVFRVVQHSTKDIYGKFITINQIDGLNGESIVEKIVEKIDLLSHKCNLPLFIYRKFGTHTYGKVGQYEIMDVFVQRFSLAGLLLKIKRRKRQ